MVTKATDARPSQLSEEYVQDSSDEGEKSAEDTSTRKERSSEVEKDDSAKKPTTNGVRVVPERQVTPASESSESSQDSSESDDDANKSDEEHSSASSGSRKRARESQKTHDVSQSSKRQKKNKETAPVRIASKRFDPPSDFEPMVLDTSDYASDAADIFTHLANKQVWHISAPATINLTSIKEFDISAALKGDPIITQNGVSYALQPAGGSNDTLLLPRDSSSAYRPSETRISRGFQLKAVEQEGRPTSNTSTQNDSSTVDAGKLVFTARAPGQSTSPRRQPAGLKTRYVPYGVIDRDKSTEGARIFPGLDGPLHSDPTMESNRTPSTPKVTAPAATNDLMDVDEPTANGSLESPQKPADPSPAKSSVPDTPREKQKRKKKRSKLVDDDGL